MGIKLSAPKIKIKAPKIKIKTPKSITGALKTITKPIETISKGGVESLGDIGSAALKGDLKGVAGGALGAVQSLKEAGKQVASGQLGFGADALGALGSLTGSKDISKLSSNIKSEGQRGVEQYGDTAMDVGANIATGGTYGVAQAATQGLASQGLQGLLSGKGLQSAALQAAGSYAGVDPTMLQGAQAGLSAAQGDLKGAALQGLGSYGGFDPKQLQMGMSALTGDKAGIASGLASQFGAGDTASNLVGQFAGGKGAREVISDQAGAYAEDEANQMLDAQIGRAGIDRGQLKQLEQEMGQIKRAPAAAKEAVEQQYKIAKGDNFNAIAKKLGVSPEALKAANPQIKDINKIAKGANLKIPKPTKPGVEDLSGGIGAGVVESGKMTQEQFDANQAFRDWSKSQTGYIGKEKKAAMQKLFQDRAAGKISADDFAIAQTNVEQGKIPKEPSATPTKETPGILDRFKGFVSGNKTGLGLGADVVAAGAGYMAGEAGRKEAKELSKQQLSELQRAGAAFEKMQYDPTRYKQEREFLQQRIAGGGITAEEKKMQQEGDIRAARAAAAQRLAGMEQQARMGAGATGAGASLAASLAGGQAAMSEQSAANLAREASASQRLEQDIQRQTNLARQKTAEEAQLAQEQGQLGLSRAQQTGAVRGDLGNLALGRAAALQNLASSGAEFAKQGLSMLGDDEQPEQTPAQQLQQVSPPPTQAKTNAARRISMGPQQKPQPPKKTSAATQFNQTNIPVGIAAPVQQAAQKVQSTVDQAKQKAEEFKKNPLGALGVKF